MFYFLIGFALGAWYAWNKDMPKWVYYLVMFIQNHTKE